MVVATLSVAPTLVCAQSVQSSQSSSTQAVSTQGPKTRAQVRAELAQARADGSIPRFGNPDPYGPGGTPNFISHSAAHTW
ncbi:DUF4148 domain-containing protein [Trinickia violacea]|nr:DUF4148 domain-containing protein [Trinickia violacea]